MKIKCIINILIFMSILYLDATFVDSLTINPGNSRLENLIPDKNNFKIKRSGTYYVDINRGDDSWDGLAETFNGKKNGPWKSISNANINLRPGETVAIRAGLYRETIRPKNNGKPNQYIKYTVYNHEKVTISGENNVAVDLSYRTFIIIKSINCKDVDRFLLIEEGHNNIIENCIFENANKYACAYLRNATLNKFYDNSFSSNPDAFDGADLLKLVSNNGGKKFDRKNGDIGSDFNLISGNHFGNARHAGLTVRGKYNVIRNNYFANPYEKNVDISWQKNMKNSWSEGDGEFNLFERNTVRSSGPDFRYAGLAISGPNNIIRFNEFHSNKGDGIEVATFGPDGDTAPFANNNRIYHNTFYNHLSETYARGKWRQNNAIGCNEWFGSVNDTRIFNNLFYKNNKPPIQGFNLSTIIGPNQNLQSSSTSHSPGCFFMTIFTHKYEVDPLFVDELEHDFRLRKESPYIDKGGPIAFVERKGSDQKIRLHFGDSYNFSDGFGVVQGDRILINNQEAIIVKINYKEDFLIIDRSINWNNGSAINFPFHGNGPDMGANEYMH